MFNMSIRKLETSEKLYSEDQWFPLAAIALATAASVFLPAVSLAGHFPNSAFRIFTRLSFWRGVAGRLLPSVSYLLFFEKISMRVGPISQGRTYFTDLSNV